MLFVGGVHAGVDADLENGKLVLKHLLVDVILIPPFVPPDGGGTVAVSRLPSVTYP